MSRPKLYSAWFKISRDGPPPSVGVWQTSISMYRHWNGRAWSEGNYDPERDGWPNAQTPRYGGDQRTISGRASQRFITHYRGLAVKP